MRARVDMPAQLTPPAAGLGGDGGAFASEMKLRAVKERGFMDGMYAVDASSVPFNDLKPIVYPDATVWRELTASRKERFGSKDMRRRGPAEKRIDAALKSPTQLEFVDTPLTDVIDYLKDYHQIDINWIRRPWTRRASARTSR